MSNYVNQRERIDDAFVSAVFNIDVDKVESAAGSVETVGRSIASATRTNRRCLAKAVLSGGAT